MKTLILTLALFAVQLTSAQEAKVQTQAAPVVLVTTAEEAHKVARLYRQQGARVRKALEFRTKHSVGLA